MKHTALLLASLAMLLSCSNEPSDYQAIENLIVGERLYRATNRVQQHDACFWEDASIRTSWQSGGVQSFVGQSPVESLGVQSTVNRSPAPLIRQNGARAFVEYPSTTIRNVKIGTHDAVLTSYMRLLYKVEKRGDAWRILELVSLNEADALAPVVPGEELSIDAELALSLRPSYRWLAYSRIAAGGSISDDLPGVDRPEDVERLYAEFEDWLNE